MMGDEEALDAYFFDGLTRDKQRAADAWERIRAALRSTPEAGMGQPPKTDAVTPDTAPKTAESDATVSREQTLPSERGQARVQELEAALEQIANHGDDDECDGDCATRMADLARDTLAATTGEGE